MARMTDDELDDFMLLVMGEYRKRKRLRGKRHQGSISRYKVYGHKREEGAIIL